MKSFKINFLFPSVLSILIVNGICAQTREYKTLAENGSIPFIYTCPGSLESANDFPESLTIPAYGSTFTTPQIQNSHHSFTLREGQSTLNCTYYILKVNMDGNSPNRLTSAGYLMIVSETNFALVHPGSFCVSEITSQELVVHLCPVNCSKDQCVQKCCPSGSVLGKKAGGTFGCQITAKEIPYPRIFVEKSSNREREDNAPSSSPVMQYDMHPGNFLFESCKETVHVNVSEPNVTEDFINHSVSLEERIGTSGTECIDHFFSRDLGPDSENGSWKVARVSCSGNRDRKLDVVTEPPSHNFLYKCGLDAVRENFVSIAEPLRMGYSEKMLHQFLSSNNYTSLFEFNLVERELECTGETFSVTVSMKNDMLTLGNKMAHLNFTPDGYVAYMATFLVEGEKKTDEIYFPRENFCISRITEDSMSLKLCKSKCSHHESEQGRNICIPKCCYLGAVMTDFGEEIACDSPPNGEWMPEFYKNELTDASIPSIHPQLHFHYDSQVQSWNCNWTSNDTLTAYVHRKAEYRILADGRVMTRAPADYLSHLAWEEVFTGTNPMEFCIDGYWDTSKPYDPKNSEVYVYRCSVNKITHKEGLALEEKFHKLELCAKILLFLVYLPCALIYLVVILIYLSIWEKQNVEGWTIMGFATSQFFVYVFIWSLLGATVFGDHAKVLLRSESLCVFTGVMHYFFSVSTFTWTLILTFDVWAKLNSGKLLKSFHRGKLQFLAYVSFAVGVPTLVSIIASGVEFSFNIWEEAVITPGFRKKCLISEQLPFLLYVVAVNSTIFAANLVFAFLTFRSIWDTKTSIENVESKSNSGPMAFENKAALVGKLMILMGFFLFFEIFFKYTNLHEVSIWFNVIESYRLFHAIGLFWIFVCSEKTLYQLQKKYPQSPVWSIIHLKERTASDASTAVELSSTAM